MSVSDTHATPTESSDRPNPGTRRRTVRNGVVGGAVAVVLSFLPLSELLGGGVAGYLDAGAGRHGAGAGAVAGLVAFVPYLLVATWLALSPGITLPGPDLALAPPVVVAGVAALAVVVVVGLGALGGIVGGILYDRA